MAPKKSKHSHQRRKGKIPTDLLMRRLAQGFLLFVSLIHLYLCPHSKVEESFNLQATHDLVYHGVTPAIMMSTSSLWYNATTAKAPLPALPYDHISYPGVVPRTFLGPLVLSSMVQILRIPGLWCSVELLDYPLLVQWLTRAMILGAVISAWCQVARALDSNKRVTAATYVAIPYSAPGTYLLLVTACQFHMPFYASRMLPNIFALLVVLHAVKAWLLEDAPKTAALLVFATAVFRCDLLLLLFTVGLSLLITKRLTVLQAIRIGVVTGIVSLVLTVPLDSLMWQRWVWPEGEVFYYNTVLGKSSDWGTSPWYWYATKALPKLLLVFLCWLPCAFFSLPETLVAWWESTQQQQQQIATKRLLDTTWWEYLLPAVGYIILYSCLGHKEVRFMFPIMPLLNLAVAVGMARVHKLVFPPSNKEKRISSLAKLGYIACLASLVLGLLASSAFLAVSQQNYPGGEALLRLNRHLHESQNEKGLVSNDSEVRLYIDVAAAMSGISLFGQRQAAGLALDETTATSSAQQSLPWKITKAGYEDANAMKEDIFEYSASFTHIIAEANASGGDGNNGDPMISTNAFTLVDVIPGSPRLDIKSGGVATQDYLYIWERIGYWKDIRQ